MSKYKGWSDRQVLDHRENQIEYLKERLKLAEAVMGVIWVYPVKDQTMDYVTHCLTPYRTKFPEAINNWTGSIDQEQK